MTSNETLSEKSVSQDPLNQFDVWYKEHLSSISEIPESVSLGTASKNGKVSVRTVLLRDYSKDGFTFFTNYTSRKGLQLLSNHFAALLFYWHETGRQVRIEGVAEKVTQQVSEIYFESRPRESQLSAWASDQSAEIPGREYLEKKYNYYDELFTGKPVPKPEHWGGFRIIPYYFEFWENGDFRLHNRVTYTRKNEIWIIARLAP